LTLYKITDTKNCLNPITEKKYEDAKKICHSSNEELILFHGTTKTNIEGILQNGFDPSKIGTRLSF
jgi:hypothetical protein